MVLRLRVNRTLEIFKCQTEGHIIDMMMTACDVINSVDKMMCLVE
jgi:hypothetical protein